MPLQVFDNGALPEWTELNGSGEDDATNLVLPTIIEELCKAVHRREDFIGSYLGRYNFMWLGRMDLTSLVGMDDGAVYTIGPLRSYSRNMLIALLYQVQSALLNLCQSPDWCNANGSEFSGTSITEENIVSQPDIQEWDEWIDVVALCRNVLEDHRYKLDWVEPPLEPVTYKVSWESGHWDVIGGPPLGPDPDFDPELFPGGPNLGFLHCAFPALYDPPAGYMPPLPEYGSDDGEGHYAPSAQIDAWQNNSLAAGDAPIPPYSNDENFGIGCAVLRCAAMVRVVSGDVVGTTYEIPICDHYGIWAAISESGYSPVARFLIQGREISEAEWEDGPGSGSWDSGSGEPELETLLDAEKTGFGDVAPAITKTLILDPLETKYYMWTLEIFVIDGLWYQDAEDLGDPSPPWTEEDAYPHGLIRAYISGFALT